MKHVAGGETSNNTWDKYQTPCVSTNGRWEKYRAVSGTCFTAATRFRMIEESRKIQAPWKNNCHLISSDITQLWLQLQSYSIPTLNLILVFLMFILKKISKKWASAQRSLKQSSACSAVQLIANFGAVQGSGWPGAWHLLWHCLAPIGPKFRDPHEIDNFSLKLSRIHST